MIIAFACDHGGFPFRDSILEHLENLWHHIIDLWPQTEESLDDFPDYAKLVCEDILNWKSERGVLVCGTGIGMSMAANRYRWIRAVLAYNPEISRISRSHNDSNVICFGARTMDMHDVIQSLDAFLETDFLWGKYQRRNEKIDCSC